MGTIASATIMANLKWRMQLKPGAEVRLPTSPSLSFSPSCGEPLDQVVPPRVGGSALLSYCVAAGTDTKDELFWRADLGRQCPRCDLSPALPHR